MALGKRLINTGGVAACNTDSTDPFGDSSGVALYFLDYDASTAPDGTDYSGSPTNVDFGVDGQINYGARFNGSSSKIDLSNLGISGAATRTISAWVNVNSLSSNQTIFQFGASAAKERFGFAIDTAGKVYVEYYGRDAITSSAHITVNNWFHVVVTYNGGAIETGTNTQIYVNGSAVAMSTTGSSTGVANTGNSNYGIGYRRASSTQYFNGSIDQVRIFSKALNSTEVGTLYAETACVYTSTTDIVNYPTGTTPVAYYKMDNSSEDYSTGGNDGTDTNIEYRFGRFGQAAVFNGSSSNIQIPTTATTPFDASSEDFAISLWVNINNFGNDDVIINKWGSSTSLRSYWLGLGPSGSNNKIYVYEQGSSFNTFASTTTLNASQWHHIVYVRNATQLLLYIDNVLQTFSATNAINQGGTQTLAIGQQLTFSGATLDGSIDQVRIYDAALTSSQVTDLYNEKPEVDTSNFKAVLYEGNGSTQYISNVGFEPDLVWIKSRTTTNFEHAIFDSVRGAGTSKVLSSDTANAEGWTIAAPMTSFDANGFTVEPRSDGNANNLVNKSGDSLVAWVWKGSNADAVSNNNGVTSGSVTAVTSTVSANIAAGFSICKFTTPSSGFVSWGHGLTSAPPELIILKATGLTQNWIVYAPSILGQRDGYLNSSAAFNSTYSPDIISVDSNKIDLGRSGYGLSGSSEYIAYCWHSVVGYSKIGSYNGSNSPISIITGFRPAFLMVKRTNATSNWLIIDSARATGSGADALYPNSSAAESTNWNTSFDSNGFTISSNEAWLSASGGNYIYMAFK